MISARLGAVATLTLCARIVSAQPFIADHEARLRFGLTGAASVSEHRADFRALPGVPNCCPQFGSGSGVGPSLGALVEVPVSRRFALDARAVYVSGNTTLTADEASTVSVAGVATPGVFRHTVTATISSIGVEPLVVYRLFEGLSLQAGGRAAYVLSTSYAQEEQITQPSTTGVFTDTGTRTRNASSGAIPDATAYAALLMAGVRYELPLNAAHTITLAPEVMASLALTPVVQGLTWYANAVRAGVSILYEPPLPAVADEHVASVEAPAPAAPTPAPLPPPPPPSPAPRPVLAATLAATGVEADGHETPVVTVRVEENISTRMRPLLPYVFFDANASTLPARYARLDGAQAKAFVLDSLHSKETLPVYRNILNIVGARLREQPRAAVTLTGCTADRGAEHGNRALALARATAVRDYLRDVWNIAEPRLKIAARDLPAKPTRPDEPYGMEENRRVEIASDTWAIVAPVVTHDTLRTATPPVVRFRRTLTAQAGAHHWALAAGQNGITLKQFAGTGSMPDSVDWHIDAEKESIPHAPTPIDAALDVADNAGQQVRADTVLAVDQVTLRRKREQRVADHTIDQYSLILFDFDRADIGDANARLCTFIKENMAPTSQVYVDGYSDVSGDSAYNQNLSQRRAYGVAHALGAQPASARGMGYTATLYPNDLPEGRFYSRTVNVTVETPVH